MITNLRYTRTFVTVGDGVPAFSPDELKNAFGELSEFDLRMHADDFVAAAHADGVDVTYQPRQGIHDWPYWRQHLAAAIRWGFFAPVNEHPLHWSYQTVAQYGDAWGLTFDFTALPETVETFRLDGRTRSATGSGTVRVHQPGGPGFTAALPFKRALPARRRAHR